MARIAAGDRSHRSRIDSQPLIEWGGSVRWYAGVPAGLDVRALAILRGGTALCWRGSCEGSRFHPLAGTTLAAAPTAEAAF